MLLSGHSVVLTECASQKSPMILLQYGKVTYHTWKSTDFPMIANPSSLGDYIKGSLMRESAFAHVSQSQVLEK